MSIEHQIRLKSIVDKIYIDDEVCNPIRFGWGLIDYINDYRDTETNHWLYSLAVF